jgi:drug/metabolite transporter (DMT)-like permease
MKSLTIFMLWAINLVVDTGGQLAFKAAASEHSTATGLAHWRFMLGRRWLWIGVGCFVLEFVAWLAFLSVVPLSQGVLLGMMGIVSVMLGGRIWFHEHFTRLRIIGVSLIVVGVALVGLG